ncbi:MAG TPA: hypothetical protein VGB57_09235, partial [Allosphingosinicella sp.]
KTGGEIFVSNPDPNFPAERQFNADSDVAVLASGTIVITWTKAVGYGVDVYAQALTPAGVETGPEFRVHAHTDAYQQSPSITALASGGYVVIWEDGLEYEGGLLGQAFDSSGAPAGNLFRVTTTVWGDQGYAAITALPGGGFVAVWDNYDTDYGTHSTRGQIFTGAGVKVGPEFRVSADSEWMQYPAAIDDLPGGGFVVTWYDRGVQYGDSSEGAIMAQVFDSAGAKVGNPFLVNSETSGNQNMPAVVALASGGFAVAWSSDSAGGYDVKAQIFMPLTGAPTDLALSPGAVLEASISNYAVATFSHNGGVNSPMTYTLLADSTDGGFRIEGNRLVVADNRRLDHETAPTASLTVRVTDVNGNSYQEALSVVIADSANEERYSAGQDFTADTSTTGGQGMAAIGALASGGYVMVWTDRGSDGSGGVVRAQMFGADGAKAGMEIGAPAAWDHGGLATAGLASGGFVVVWKDFSPTGGDSSGSSIKGRRFDGSGAQAGGEFLVNTTTDYYQEEPSVAALSSGGFVVTWTDNSPRATGAYDSDIRAQIYDSAGAKVGGEFVVNSTTFYEQTDPVVASLPGGGFVIAWSDYPSHGVSAQRFDAAGNKVGGEILVGSSPWAGPNPAIAVLASGGFVISWYGDQLVAQIFDSTGAKSGAAFVVSEIGYGHSPTISALPSGGFVLAWQEGGGAQADVRAQRFDSAGARIGGEFVVPSQSEGSRFGAVSTTLSSGSFVVGWTESGAVSAVEGRVFSLIQPDNSGDDILTGDSNANLLDGGAGNDQIHGLAGNDDLRGGDGDDILDGGAGNDVVSGGYGDDTAYVSGGTTSADTGTETVDLGFNLSGPGGGEEAGTDHLIVDYSNITEAVQFAHFGPSHGPAGASATIQIGGVERLSFSGVGRLTLTTGSGGDLVYAIGRDDIISTGAGNDIIHAFDSASGGRHRIDGGTGIDVAFRVNWSDLEVAVVLDLNDPQGVTIGSGAGERYLRGIEAVVGFTSGSGDDVVVLDSAGALGNLVSTGLGSDTVVVFGGDTYVSTGQVAVNLGAGPGTDELFADFSAATESVYFQSEYSGGTVSIGGVQRHGYSGAERLFLQTGSADDTVDGREGGTVAYGFSTGAGDDLLYGGELDDVLQGGIGNDRLEGGAGHDRLYGDGGNDQLLGGAGNDWLSVEEAGTVTADGGGDSDTLTIVYVEATTAITMSAPAADPNGGLAGTLGDGVGRSVTYGGIEQFVVLTGSGNDIVGGGAGDDYFNLGGGSDLLYYTGGTDYADGGEGIDGIFGVYGTGGVGIVW